MFVVYCVFNILYIHMFICTLKMTRQRKNRTSINICSKLIWVLCSSIYRPKTLVYHNPDQGNITVNKPSQHTRPTGAVCYSINMQRTYCVIKRYRFICKSLSFGIRIYLLWRQNWKLIFLFHVPSNGDRRVKLTATFHTKKITTFWTKDSKR